MMKVDSFFSNGLKPTRFSKESVLEVILKNSGLGIMGTFCPDMFYRRIHGIGVLTLVNYHKKSTIHVRKCASAMDPMGYG